ncbi:unnamed protein product, partial [Amoebophrya sp. A120]|eukprot:GSA120T00024761001.1
MMSDFWETTLPAEVLLPICKFLCTKDILHLELSGKWFSRVPSEVRRRIWYTKAEQVCGVWLDFLKESDLHVAPASRIAALVGATTSREGDFHFGNTSSSTRTFPSPQIKLE